MLRTLLIVSLLYLSSVAEAAPLSKDIPAAWYEGRLPILRFKKDDARDRGWILTTEGVLLFDFKSRRTLGFAALPGWQWLRRQYACQPDIAIGPRGEVVVSSNVLPTLWRIDPSTLEVTRHEPRLDQDTGRDIGFAPLTWSPKHAAYFGISSLQGSVWRIEASLTTARRVSTGVTADCGEL